ncbi:hypothetical protein DVH24_014922 [Malus domestica]|uniref:Elongation factor P C-terminal domain-containing protein n=1 Tax=Malus domestica TaxID=3750 RepID=A0A498K7G2_MALDO|nr:hypothetical protein DVH24_014922 [Malus domestica]
MGYICLKMVKHCVPQTWNKPVPGGRWDAKTPKICPVEQPVPPIFGAPNAGRNASSRPVPRGGTKRATLDTGAVVYVPLFVNVGDEILVDTRTG